MTEPVSTSAATGGVLGSILNAFEAIANILYIVDFFTATMKPEVHQIYKYTYDTRENLKKIMKKLGVHYNIEIPKDLQNNWEKMTEGIHKTYRSARDPVDEAMVFNSEVIREFNIKINKKTEELYDKAMDFLSEYPFIISTPLVGEAATPTDEGQAKAEREKISGEVFNAGGNNYQVIEIAKIAREVVGEDVEIEIKDVIDERSYHISSEKIANVLGFVPKRTVYDAIAEVKNAFAKDLIPDYGNPRYYNVKKMKELGLS